MPRDEHAGATTPSPAWERVDLTDPASRARLEGSLDTLAARTNFTLFHDPRWLVGAEGRTPDDAEVLVVRKDGEIVAYAAFVKQPWSLRFRLGEVVFARVRLRRLHANAGPLAGEPGVDDEAMTTALLREMRPRLSARDVLFFEGVEVGGAVERGIRGHAARLGYRILEASPPYERQRANLPSTFDAYLGAMKSQTRQNLRNARRKLERHAALRLVCCRTPDDVPSYVDAAIAVSRKTYQWRLLGLGLRDREGLVATLTAMANAGCTRCYLLECDGVPTAFMLGYLYRGTYYYVDVGFDPDWEKWSVGTVLHMDVLRDLIEGPDEVRAFDFSSGTGVHKKRFGNVSRLETSYALLPASVRSRALIAAHRGTDRLSAGAARALDAIGVKGLVKRWIRRTASAKETASGEGPTTG